jgi:hypothetical protein
MFFCHLGKPRGLEDPLAQCPFAHA